MAQSGPNSVKSDQSSTEKNKVSVLPVCGIVMPIAPMGDEYSEAHWMRVRRILIRAIDRAGMSSKLVWENPEIDVIQSAILQNIYENDVIICDVSGLNPNVMLETGLRLSTKKPIVIVTDKIIRPPFDINNIGYIDYQRDLEYNAIELFIEKLSKKLIDVTDAYSEGRYRSYIENFTFETVEPTAVSVTSEQYVKDRIDELANIVKRIEISQRNVDSPRRNREAERRTPIKRDWRDIGKLTGHFNEEFADRVENQIDKIIDIFCVPDKVGKDIYEFDISLQSPSNLTEREALALAKSIIDKAEADFIIG